MTSTSKTIVFFGNERLATGVSTEVPTLKSLIKKGYHIAAVVSHFEQASSRSTRRLEIADVAQANNIPVLLPAKPSEIADQLKSYNPAIGVLVAYGKIVPQSIIDIFPHGIINIHPSKLPKHRGPTPIESVLLAGDTNTAVSIMSLSSKMDAGPIYKQQQVTIQPDQTKQQLADKLLQVGSDLITQLLPDILNGSLKPTDQDESKVTIDQLITKQNGHINWSKSAVQIEREIRAYAEWPKSYTKFKDLDVVITKAHVVEQKNVPGLLAVVNKELIVYCGQDALAIDMIKPAGKPEMSATAFINGYSRYL